MMDNRPRKYRNVASYIYQGHTVEGLKQRPDGRFYAAAKPTRTFGTDPAEAVTRFMAWRTQVVTGNERARDFPFWRDAFRRLILDQPRLAGRVLGVKGLEEMYSYDELFDSDWESIPDWSLILTPADQS